jgi:hypothetical protein
LNRRAPDTARLASALALCAALSACDRPLPPGPDTSIELVRRGLATGDEALVERHADGRFVADVAYLRASIEAIRYAGHGHEGHSETLTPSLFERTWTEHQRLPRRAWPTLRPALPWLGGGRCAREGSAPVPDAFAPLPPADAAWPESLKARHAEVSQQLSTVFSLRVRCAPGARMIVTLLPSTAPAGAPRVLAIQRD